MQTLLIESFSIAITLCAVLLFGSAGLHKLNRENGEFFKSVVEGFMLPKPLGSQISIRCIGIIEITVVCLCILPATHALALLAAAIILVGYAAVMAQALIRGAKNIRCGCAGPGHEAPVSSSRIYRNILLAVAFAMASAAPISGELAPTIIAVALASVLTTLYLSAEQLLNNHAQLSAIKHVRKL